MGRRKKRSLVTVRVSGPVTIKVTGSAFLVSGVTAVLVIAARYGVI